ncbi:AaceriAGL023Wp [[Ashbya] aceris (nom. inval.)]|nr:AaceriAGL023Wp [[Ashbya] aceris (nom. inval.)]
MGRLIGLELKNFKSYKGVHNVGFGGKNFISIVGPNGSGKSNMMDAISFVLGIRSSHLRSSALVDLIYRGRMDEGGDVHENNPKSAYVTAFYVKPDASGAERRMEFTRVIHNTGDSTYKLDGKTVGYKEYVDVLEGEHILVKARNFLVFQGDVEQIASQSGLDLTKLFEQVSGSVQYQREYERLKDEYEKASTEYNESLKTRRKMQIDLKSFKEGVQKEEQYISLLAEREKLQQQFMLWQLFHLQNKRSGLVTSLKDSKAKLSQLKRQLSNEEAILSKSKSLVAKEELVIARRREALLQKQQEKARLNAQLLPVGSARQGTTRRIANIEKRIDSLQRDIERQESYVKQLNNQLKVVGKTKASFEAELEKSASGKFKLSEEQKKEYEELKEVYLSSGGSEFEEKLALLQNKKEELLEEIAVFEKRIGLSKARAEHDLKVDIERLEVEISERTANLNDKNAIHSDKVREWKQIQSEIESANNKEYELSYKLREVLAKLDDLSANQRETNKERKLRENVATLRRLFPGVRGLVHDLCRPKKDKYAVGVSTILGKNFDSVIVDSLSVAQQCISYLKKHRSGVASFIPLDTIDTSSPTLPPGDNTGCILTLDAIEYDSSLEKAMQYACSDSIICDSLDIARNLKWNRNVKAKLVTLEGALIHRAGLMTGGITKNNSNRWDKEEYQSLLLLKDKISTELSELTTTIRTGSIKSREYENEVSLLSTEISSLRSQLNQLNRSLKEAMTELNYHNDLIEKEYSPKVDSLHNMVRDVDEQMAEIAKNKANLQESVYKDFSKKIGFNIGEYEQHTGGRLREHSRELQQLQKELMNIENKLEFETERLESTRKRQQKAKEDLKKVQGELDSLISEETDIQSNLERVANQIAEDTKVLEEAQEKLKKKGNNIKLIEDTINDLQDSIQACKREITEWKEDIEKVGIERVNILKNCKMTNIDLPLDSSALENLPIERIDAETIEAGNNISIDYSRLSARYKESSSHHIRDEFESSIKAIDNTLTELQPNSKAVERFDEARDQFNAVSGESDKLKEGERKTKELYLKIKEKRVNTFLACFNHVRDNIDRIYRELTRNPGSTAELAGGSASLTLEDEDEPYLGGIRYHATPPMKRFKDMDYLSGGEKTMAALALLFAINSYQPSPFFILDEVDAALDVTNVERIAAYIRRHASPQMQFIVISLKSNLFSKSESMAGVFRNQHENSSMVITTDLTQYADDM